MTLHPVLITVPHAPDEPPPERMRKQREYARRALRHCAKLIGAPDDRWQQEKGGAPLPNGEFYWSISHTRGLAAAVIAREPVGIDVERIRRRRRDIFKEVGTQEEWFLLGGQSWPAFFKLWTAKEAVLKANSLGIGHLDQCHLTTLGHPSPGSTHSSPTKVEFRTATWLVHHHHLDPDHIAALAATDMRRIEWQRLS